jgi:predicted DNA-binding transcriptional regulator YafY
MGCPYVLALIDDGWYAVGYCHNRLDIRMFAIQRVKSARETGETFDRPPGFRLDEYLTGSFRALRGEGDHDVILQFSPDLARRIAERSGTPGRQSSTSPTAGFDRKVRQQHVAHPGRERPGGSLSLAARCRQGAG